MSKLIFVFNALLLIISTRAQVFGPLPCGEFDVDPSIKNNEDLKGVWYEYAKTPRPLSEGLNSTCIHFDRLEINGDEWPFKQYWVNPSDGSKYVYEGLSYVDGPGIGETSDGYNYTTVYADRDAIVVYACGVFFLSKVETIWVLTRNEYPDPGYMVNAFQKMKELGINDKVKMEKHNYCPKDWSDAKIITDRLEIAKQGRKKENEDENGDENGDENDNENKNEE